MDKYLTPTFGILGGMGALAGTSLGDRFMREAARRGAQADETFPRLVQLSLAPAGLDAHGLAGDQQQLRQELLAQLDILADIGVSCVLPACNSISALHLEHSYLRILDPVALAVAALVRGNVTRVAVLCSQTSDDLGLFTEPLTAAGITVIPLQADERSHLTELIAQLMGGQQPLEQLHQLIAQLSQRGAETIVLGCSELSLMAEHFPDVCDPMRCLIDSALECYARH